METSEPKPRRALTARCQPLGPGLALALLACLTSCAPNRISLPQASIAAAPPVAAVIPPMMPVPELVDAGPAMLVDAGPAMLVDAGPAMLVDAGPAMLGTASWYAPGPGLHRTCTGENFTRDEMTAASPSIPLGTQVRVALRNADRSVVVRVNDCMPHGRRILDLSEAAAAQLGLMQLGIARVTVTPVMLVDKN